MKHLSQASSSLSCTACSHNAISAVQTLAFFIKCCLLPLGRGGMNKPAEITSFLLFSPLFNYELKNPIVSLAVPTHNSTKSRLCLLFFTLYFVRVISAPTFRQPQKGVTASQDVNAVTSSTLLQDTPVHITVLGCPQHCCPPPNNILLPMFPYRLQSEDRWEITHSVPLLARQTSQAIKPSVTLKEKTG